MKNLDKNGHKYSRSILGIISLMIIGITFILIASTSRIKDLSDSNQTLLIALGFAYLFVVLGGFLWIVAKHPELMIDVRNFKDQESYIKTLKILLSIYMKKGKNSTAKTEQEIREDFNDITQGMEDCFKQTMENVQKQDEDKRYILWVDDNPDNNTYERIALEQYGFHFVLATSTNEALSLIYKEKYNAIIFDMERKEGMEEGYKLFEEIKKRKISTPYFIYTDYCDVGVEEIFLKKGIKGITADPQDLIEMVSSC